MKKLQIILLFVLLSFAYSCKDDDNPVKDDDPVDTTPTIELTAYEGLIIEASATEEELTYYTQITNTGDEDIEVVARMEIIELAEPHWTYFCWGDITTGEGICYERTKEDFTADFNLKVKAGTTTDKNSFIHYMDNESNSTNTSKIRYIVYEANNKNNADTLEYTINLTSGF